LEEKLSGSEDLAKATRADPPPNSRASVPDSSGIVDIPSEAEKLKRELADITTKKEEYKAKYVTAKGKIMQIEKKMVTMEQDVEKERAGWKEVEAEMEKQMAAAKEDVEKERAGLKHVVAEMEDIEKNFKEA
jgi:chromosome segregation ATPase